MKNFKTVEKERLQNNLFKNFNSVHRSSLLVPQFEKAHSIISFLNHFLIKRNFKSVVLKVTAIDIHGSRIESRTFDVNEPRVYKYNLTEIFEKKANNFLVEFFSNSNLAVPFPAVIINHMGKDFCNSVHSYNRVVNDVFEDDQQNKVQVNESSIDVKIDKNFDTFFIFSSGIEMLKNKDISINYQNKKKKKLKINLNRLSHKKIYLSKFIKKNSRDGVLKINQPYQKLFYGRLLVGIENKKTKAFCANHSYYDSSSVKEYFHSPESFRTYPFISEYQNKIAMYPIMSPSKLNVKIVVHCAGKDFETNGYKVTSPSLQPLYININDIVKKNKLKKVYSFSIIASAKNKKVPTRINHNLIYATKLSKPSLNSSINVSLKNNSVRKFNKKNFYKWGQFLTGRNYKSTVGICFDDIHAKPEKVKVNFYNSDGLIKQKKYMLYPKRNILISSDEIFKTKVPLDFLWYSIVCKNNNISAFTVQSNLKSGNTCGEHNF